MNTLNIYDQASKGRIKFIKKKDNILIGVSLDNYGFQVKITKEQLKELIK